MSNESAKAQEVLRELERTRFWGSIQFDYQDGQIILLRKTQTMKLNSQPRGNTNGTRLEDSYR
jgi:hypothetical protein